LRAAASGSAKWRSETNFILRHYPVRPPHARSASQWLPSHYDFCRAPKSDINVVGAGKKGVRNLKAKRLGRLEIEIRSTARRL
jgi:hypothetical protein